MADRFQVLVAACGGPTHRWSRCSPEGLHRRCPSEGEVSARHPSTHIFEAPAIES
jgi:hypothetical protein